jgi:hypothetical protein
MDRFSGRGVRAAGFVLAGAIVGSLLGPPIASAVGSLVTIEGSGSSNKAKVTPTGRLQVDTGGVGTQTFTCGPSNQQCTALDVNASGRLGVNVGGDTLIGSGTAGTTVSCQGTAAAMTVDNTTAATSTVSISAQLGGPGGGGGGSVGVWQGTVPAGGHVNDSFGTGGIQFNQLTVAVTGAAQWYLYGQKFCPPGGSPATRSRP